MRKCQASNCGYNVFSNNFCQRHQHLRQDERFLLKKNKPSILKKPKQATSKVYRIPKVSKKMSKSLKVYHLKRLIYLGEHKNCEARLDGCSGFSTTIHHKKGRGLYLNDVSTWLACCMECHSRIELEPVLAKEKGLSVSRLSKD